MTGVGSVDEPLRIARLFPDLLGAYADGGNTLVLHRRAAWRGLSTTIIDVTADATVPADAHLYLIGGGEGLAQLNVSQVLGDSGVLTESVEAGSAVLGVCGGFQMLGSSFPAPDGRLVDGLGLVDIATTQPAGGEHMNGEVVTASHPELGLGRLTGYENHFGVTELGPQANPLGHVIVGGGNGADGQLEGAWQGQIVGTYLHGPVLARNPALADLLLAWALGKEPSSLEVLDDEPVDVLRRARFSAAGVT